MRDLISRLYLEIVGYDLFTDDPSMSTQDGALLLLEILALHGTMRNGG